MLTLAYDLLLDFCWSQSSASSTTNYFRLLIGMPMDKYDVDEMEMEGFLTDTPAHYYTYTSIPNNQTQSIVATETTLKAPTGNNNSRRRTTTKSKNNTRQLKRRRQVLVGLAAVVIGITTILRLGKFQVSTNVPNEPQVLPEKNAHTSDGVDNNDYHHDTYNNSTEISPVDVSVSTISPITIDEEEQKVEEEQAMEATTQEEEEVIEQPKSQTVTHQGSSSKDKWGYWKFYDGYEKNRPKEDYWSKYPSKDVKAIDLPLHAWQADPVYINHFLDEAKKLITRAKEAILEEYGYGQPRNSQKSVEALKMFRISMVQNITTKTTKGGIPQECIDQGGWTTKQSFTSLARRLLHAMVTKDTFTVVMGGDSSAAGYGNHFSQSYMMQFHHVMEPVMEHLGVNLITRNMAQKGGALPLALGAQSLYGDDVDVIIWDSSMVQPEKWEFDLFCRQVLLGSRRAPFLLLGAKVHDDYLEVLQRLHDTVGADVGGLGSGLSGIPVTVDEVQVAALPWVTHYLTCDPQSTNLCTENKYRTQCWVERSDIAPPTKQKDSLPIHPSYPGFRQHQLIGRVLTFFLLQALDQAVSVWSEKTVVEGMPLADEYWHMSQYYSDIQQRVKDMPPSFCEEGSNGRFPPRLCKVPLKARTENTPRAHPNNTSITSILQRAPPDGYLPLVAAPLYEGNDVPNPATTLPEGAVDVRSILNKRHVRYIHNLRHLKQKSLNNTATENKGYETLKNTTEKEIGTSITPGRGWVVHSEPSGYCDGSAKSSCGRQITNDCLLSGHNDGKGGVQGDGLSGWLVMTLDDLKEGIVIMNIDFMHDRNPRKPTTAVDDENRKLKKILNSSEIESGSEEFHHIVANDTRSLPDNTIFEYSTNGTIISLNKSQLIDRIGLANGVAQWIVLLNNEEISTSGRAFTMELAVRIVGCKRECTMSINHIYWA